MAIALRTAAAEEFGTMTKMEAIDLSFLDRVTFRDRSLAREVLVLFGQQAESLLTLIAEAGDERTRREAAHKLKGAARGVGAFSFGDAAAAAEPVDPANAERAKAAIKTLEIEAQSVHGFIQTYLAA